MSNTYNALIHAKQDGTGEEVANNKTAGGDGSLYAPVTSIATPESGDTSSKAYAVGEMFIRGGKLCTCIVAISSGDTLAKDTNYKEGDVGSVLTELNSNIAISPVWVYSENISSATTLQYTGLSCSIPKDSYFSILAGIQYSNTRPVEIALSIISSSTPTASEIYDKGEKCHASISGLAPKQLNIYLYGRWQASGKNTAWIGGWYKPA